MVEIVFLGSGPARIVDKKGKNRRLNSSVLIKYRGKNILIDVTPYFLEQTETNKINRIDYILFTHGHNDCTGGIAQLKEWMKRNNITKPIMAYLEPTTEKRIREDFDDVSHLAFSYFNAGSCDKPIFKTLTFDGIKIIPIRVEHSIQKGYPTVAFKINNELIYSEDVGKIPAKSRLYYSNIAVLILDAAMWFDRQIKGHLNTQDALNFIKELKNVKKVILTQAGHTYPAYEEARKIIRETWEKMRESKTEVDLAYDGMIIDTRKLYEIIEFSETMKETKEAIYLPKPHAELIWKKKKKFIIKAKRYPRMIGKLLYLIDKRFAYGIIRLKKPYPISLKQFKEYQKSHLVTDKERIKWWRGKQYLFMYPYELVEKFKIPKKVEVKKGIQTFVKDIKFLNETYELIKNIKNYDPSKPNNEQLADDWRIVCGYYSDKKTERKKIALSIEDIINLAKIIHDEIVKRVEAGKMKHEFKPEEMKPYSKELYNIVSKKEIIQEEMEEIIEKIEDLKPFLNEFPDFEIIHHFVSLVGSTVKHKSGHEPKDYDLHIRMKDPSNYVKRAVEVRLLKILPEKIANKIHFVWGDPEGSHDTFVPLYNLKVERVKPEEVIKMEQKLTDIDAMLKEISLMKSFLPLKSTAEFNKSLFYDFDKVIETLKPSQLQPLIVEEKFDGFRGVLHKKGNQIKIFSDQAKDVTMPFPTLVAQAKKISDENFILDGELVPYDERGQSLGRRGLMEFIGAIKSGKKVDDSRIKYHVFDVLYFKDKPVIDLKLYERKKILQTLRWTSNILNIPFITVKNSEQLAKAIKIMRALPKSEGAMIKTADSLYAMGKTPNWIKYRIVVDIHVKVLDIFPVKEAKAWRYKCGIKIVEKEIEKINSKYIEEFGGEKYLIFGNTFNTSLKAEKGDILDVSVQEIWEHRNKEGLIRFSWHKPNVRQKSDRSATSTIEDLKAIVVSRGVLVKEWETVMQEFSQLRLELNEEGREVKPTRDFPDRMQKNFKEVMESGKWYPYVMQWHFRGRGVHTDLRHLIPDGYLEGFTLFTPRSIEKTDLFLGGKNIRGTIKLIQPVIWLKFDKITQKGGAGATIKYPGIFVIVGKGKYTIHEVEDHKIILEYKSDSGLINKTSLRKAEKMGLPIKDPGDKLINISGKWSYHIAHIRPTEWIMLFDKVK